MTMRYKAMRVHWARFALLASIAWIFFRQFRVTPLKEQNEASDIVGKALTPSNFAYASLIGGVDPSSPSYRGFFYNILVAAKLLRMFGSNADFVVFFQLSHETSLEELPARDASILRAMHVIVEYIPKSRYQSFYEITLEKFRILQLTQYKRVLFMDADIMPLANLDYLFKCSTGINATMLENIVVAGTQEPSTAGFFVLAPKQRAMDELHQIISTREFKAKDLPFPKFDIVQGWGHAIVPPDRWETTVESRYGNNWTFYSADADQGLLYEYTKYVQQRVSIVIGDRVQNWLSGENGFPRLDKVLQNPFQNTRKRIRKWAIGPPPYHHFYHFTGRSKPWERGIPDNLTEYNHRKTPERFWFFHLLKLNQELKLFDANNWEAERAVINTPPLGRFHVKADMAWRVERSIQGSV